MQPLESIIKEADQFSNCQLREVLSTARNINADSRIAQKKGTEFMKIELKSSFFEMSLDMSEGHALELLQQALKYMMADMFPKSSPLAEEPVSLIPAQCAVEVTPEDKDDGELSPTYTGFLYLRCEKCGKEKGFCAKIPTSTHRCECGHYTRLKKLRPARAICKCGGDYTYKTNITDQDFSMECLKCGAPIDLAMTRNWDSFYTLLGGNNDGPEN